MNRRIRTLSLPFLFSFQCCLAQDTTWFTKGIAVTGVHHYGREAIYTDQLAYRMYNHTLAAPLAGASSGITDSKGNDIQWQVMEADSLKRFRSRQFGGGGGGYMYFTYNADKEKPALLNISGCQYYFF